MFVLDNKLYSTGNQTPDAQTVIHGSRDSAGSFSKCFHTPHLSYKLREKD